MAAVVLGGTHGGVGKTTLARGITEALRSEGLKVSSYTVGPGLSVWPSGSTKPGQLLEQAVGLDGWLLSQDAVRAAVYSRSADTDISIIEGCFGMFDSPSADGSEQGSTAQIAQWLQVPVVLIVDSSTFNTARGVVALVKGYTAVDGGLSVAGVILNKVTSASLAAEVQEALKQAAADVAVLGAVPKVEKPTANSVTKSSCPWSPRSSNSASLSSCVVDANGSVQLEQSGLDEQHMVQLVQQHVDLQLLQALSAKATVPRPQKPLPSPARTFRVSMGVACDAAFQGYFQQNLHMLTAAGVQLVPFSPLHDSQLPPGLSAILLGGSCLTDWMQELSGNAAMLEAVRAFAAAGGLVVGEGAGLMYLAQSAQQPGQRRYAMVGLFPFHTQILPQLSHGKGPSYVEVNVQQHAAHPLLLPGSKLRGITTCHCHVVEERLVGGLAAAFAAASSDQQQTIEAGDGSSSNGEGVLLSSGADSSNSVARSLPVTHSYSCVPLAQPDMPAIQEGYTSGTALASCVQVHYGSCPEVVQHMVQRCLRVDVASVTAAASTAAKTAAARAAEAAAAARQQLLLPAADSPRVQGLYSPVKQQGAGSTAASPVRPASAPDLQHMWAHRQLSSDSEAADALVGPSGGVSGAGSYAAASGGRMQTGLSTRKSASIPSNMYQQGFEQLLQQQQPAPSMGHHSRQGSFGSSTPQQQQQHEAGQQQGWHPQLPLHVPKRWSLELQRLGSFTSQLIPGVKSPTGQQPQHQQQQSRLHQGDQNPRGSSFAMGHLPEEAPLSDEALKLLDNSLPVKLGRTHHTHIGVAVPLSSTTSSTVSGGAAVPGQMGLKAQQQWDADDAAKCPSIHEQMSQMAASLVEQDASAAVSLCTESVAAVTDADVPASCFAAPVTAGLGSAAPLGEQKAWSKANGSVRAVEGLPLVGFPLQKPGQRLVLDQYNTQLQQQLQGHVPTGEPASSRTRYSLESAYPAAASHIQQQLQSQEQQPGDGQLTSQELSFRGMLGDNLQQPGASGGSSVNLKAAGTLSRNSSSGKLASAAASVAAAAGPGSGGNIISLSPAATDCLVALGLASRLAGVTDACRIGQSAATAGAAGCMLGQLLTSIGAPWASETAEAEASCSTSKNSISSSGNNYSNIPVVCRLVDGPDGLPRYKLDEDHIRRVQPSLVIVACEENSDDELHLQHYQQLKLASSDRPAFSNTRALSTLGQGSNVHGTSTLNGAVAQPGRVRLQVAVVQRVLQRAGVLWPEQRAVVLYQRCHSLAEVLEFMLVLAQAAGVPERGMQLVEGLRARMRAAAARLCFSSEALSRRASIASSYSSRHSSNSCSSNPGSSSNSVVVLESVSPLRMAGFWVPEMLQLAGAGLVAVAPAAAEPSAAVTWPQLRSAAPDTLVLALPGLSASEAAVHTADLASLPGFWSLPAVRSGAVYVCDHTLLARPGPGVVLGVELLGHLVAPDRQQLPSGLVMGSVLKLSLHSGQRCRPRLVPNYMSRYC